MLSTVPGITFGAAEGGSPPADSINFRGYSAGSDITQDGVRDSAAYSRSDSFNLEQLEIVNGANSVQSGASSVGGSINIFTKRPLGDTRIVGTAGIGTAADRGRGRGAGAGGRACGAVFRKTRWRAACRLSRRLPGERSVADERREWRRPCRDRGRCGLCRSGVYDAGGDRADRDVAGVVARGGLSRGRIWSGERPLVS